MWVLGRGRFPADLRLDRLMASTRVTSCCALSGRARFARGVLNVALVIQLARLLKWKGQDVAVLEARGLLHLILL